MTAAKKWCYDAVLIEFCLKMHVGKVVEKVFQCIPYIYIFPIDMRKCFCDGCDGWVMRSIGVMTRSNLGGGNSTIFGIFTPNFGVL